MEEVFHHQVIDVGKKRPYVLTECRIVEGYPLSIIKSVGISICCPKDQYNRKLGNIIARGRAIKALAEKKSINPLNEKLADITGYEYSGIYNPGCEVYLHKV